MEVASISTVFLIRVSSCQLYDLCRYEIYDLIVGVVVVVVVTLEAEIVGCN